MDFTKFGRPSAFTEDVDLLFLSIFEAVNINLLEQKRCNQYDVAIELKRLFNEAKHDNPLTAQKHLVNKTTLKNRLDLCEFLYIDYFLSEDFYFYSDEYEQLDVYISSASPVAIVQMKKRIKRLLFSH